MLTQQRLMEVLSYNRDTGEFVWKLRKAGIRHGAVAGYSSRRGEVFIRVDGGRYAAHRLAWLYCYGVWPSHEIDHINGTPSDNRISNLRDVPHTVNQQNFRRAFRTNGSAGRLGVSLHSKTGLFRARITVNKKEVSLGYYKTAEDAHIAYVTAKRQLHKGCTI